MEKNQPTAPILWSMTKIVLIDRTGDVTTRTVALNPDGTFPDKITTPATLGGVGGRPKDFAKAATLQVKEMPGFQLPVYVENRK